MPGPGTTTRMTTKVSIVEDDAAFREHLVSLIRGAPGYVSTGAHGSAEAALKSVPCERPDVLLLDLELPGKSGLDCIHEFKARLPKLEVLVLTICDDTRRIFGALESGATGYLHKPPTSSVEILDAIREIRAGGSPMSAAIARLVVKTFQQHRRTRREVEKLSPREQEILELVSRGQRNAEIAHGLHISEFTVSTHLHRVYEKLQVHNRSAATAKYLQR
jgi:DNA-binding NarL/FixJ family response regulator